MPPQKGRISVLVITQNKFCTIKKEYFAPKRIFLNQKGCFWWWPKRIISRTHKDFFSLIKKRNWWWPKRTFYGWATYSNVLLTNSGGLITDFLQLLQVIILRLSFKITSSPRSVLSLGTITSGISKSPCIPGLRVDCGLFEVVCGTHPHPKLFSIWRLSPPERNFCGGMEVLISCCF